MVLDEVVQGLEEGARDLVLYLIGKREAFRAVEPQHEAAVAST